MNTYKSKFLIVLSVLIAALLLLPATSLAADGPEALIAQSAILVERDSGTVLYEYNADERRAPDSMVKLMTLLLAAEAVESGDVLRNEYVTASEGAFFDITSDSETRGITAGESMPFIDLMYCAFVGSANEACNIIAEHVSGSVGQFVELMNKRARELGCADTVFTNTHGQKDTRQYSTARDLSKITIEAAKSPLFTEVAGAISHTTAATDTSAPRSMTNSNYMLDEDRTRFYYKYAVFGKVSATYESGYGCTEYAERNGMSLISVMLGSSAIVTDDGTIYQNMTETKRLLEWGFESYSWRTVLAKTKLVGKVPVELGDGADYVNLRVAEDVILLLRNDVEDSSVTRELRLYGSDDDGALTAPVEAGAVLGELDVFVDGRLMKTVKLEADASIGLQRVSLLRRQIMAALGSTWFKVIVIIAALLFAAYAAIVIRYNVIRARRVREIQAKKQNLAEHRRRHHDDRE